MKETIRPFSNGTEAMQWYDDNCTRCTKAFFPKIDGNYPSDTTMKKYCSIGKECKLKYAIDWSFITSEILLDIAKQIGIGELGGLKETCMFFSDNDDDRFKYPKGTPVDNSPMNQLVMPLILDEDNFNKPKRILALTPQP